MVRLVDSEMTRNGPVTTTCRTEARIALTYQDGTTYRGCRHATSVCRLEIVLPWANPPTKDRAKHSRVTFDIEPMTDAVRLTVTHDELEDDSPMLHGISKGWPFVLSSLKTLLETGRAMPMTMKRMTAPPA